MDAFYQWVDSSKLTHLAKTELCKMIILMVHSGNKTMSFQSLVDRINRPVAERIRDMCRAHNGFLNFSQGSNQFELSDYMMVKGVDNHADSSAYRPVLTLPNLTLTSEYKGLFPLPEKDQYFVVSHHLIKSLDAQFNNSADEIIQIVYESVLNMTPKMRPQADKMASFIKHLAKLEYEKRHVTDVNEDDKWIEQLVGAGSKRPSIINVCQRYQA
jgi:hypothetical protein